MWSGSRAFRAASSSIDELIPQWNLSGEELGAIGDKATRDPLYRDRLVSGNRRTVGMLMEFENYPEVGH